MPNRSPTENRPKAAVSVSEMARLCSLSRSHFNLLIRTGVMPQPLYSLHNRRPFYDREHQEQCLRVKETNTAIDGRYVVFYDRRRVTEPSASPRRSGGRAAARPVAPAADGCAELVEGLRSLGMDADAAAVDAALRACYPSGHGDSDEGTVLRQLWRYLRRS